MRHCLSLPVLAVLALPFPALANEIDGRVERVDTETMTLTVVGVDFHVEAATRYDDGLRSLADVAVGQGVELTFTLRDGRHVATKVDADDDVDSVEEASGRVDAVDAAAMTLSVAGIAFTTDAATRYDDGLGSLVDVTVGRAVEVDFRYADGRRQAVRIEGDD